MSRYARHGVAPWCDCKRCVGMWSLRDHYQLSVEERMLKGKTAVPTSQYEAPPDLKEYKYFIWSPESHLPPKVVFDSKPAAIKVAYSMASKYPDSRFCVCQIEGVARATKVSFEDFGK